MATRRERAMRRAVTSVIDGLPAQRLEALAHALAAAKAGSNGHSRQLDAVLAIIGERLEQLSLLQQDLLGQLFSQNVAPFVTDDDSILLPARFVPGVVHRRNVMGLWGAVRQVLAPAHCRELDAALDDLVDGRQDLTGLQDALSSQAGQSMREALRTEVADALARIIEGVNARTDHDLAKVRRVLQIVNTGGPTCGPEMRPRRSVRWRRFTLDDLEQFQLMLSVHPVIEGSLQTIARQAGDFDDAAETPPLDPLPLSSREKRVIKETYRSAAEQLARNGMPPHSPALLLFALMDSHVAPFHMPPLVRLVSERTSDFAILDPDIRLMATGLVGRLAAISASLSDTFRSVASGLAEVSATDDRVSEPSEAAHGLTAEIGLNCRAFRALFDRLNDDLRLDRNTELTQWANDARMTMLADAERYAVPALEDAFMAGMAPTQAGRARAGPRTNGPALGGVAPLAKCFSEISALMQAPDETMRVFRTQDRMLGSVITESHKVVRDLKQALSEGILKRYTEVCQRWRRLRELNGLLVMVDDGSNVADLASITRSVTKRIVTNFSTAVFAAVDRADPQACALVLDHPDTQALFMNFCEVAETERLADPHWYDRSLDHGLTALSDLIYRALGEAKAVAGTASENRRSEPAESKRASNAEDGLSRLARLGQLTERIWRARGPETDGEAVRRSIICVIHATLAQINHSLRAAQSSAKTGRRNRLAANVPLIQQMIDLADLIGAETELETLLKLRDSGPKLPASQTHFLAPGVA